jgi:3-oxoacyl-[acyl-carrier protein] reductase
MNVIVTGISKGLGLRITKLSLKKGWTIFGISRTNSDELSQLLVQYPDKLKWLQYNLQNACDIQQIIFKDWIGHSTPIHGFVNNAAFAYDDIVTNLKLDLLEKMYQVNVFTPMLLTKYVIRQMLLHHTKGSIVHISSISVHTGSKGLAMYASTKGALEAFSKNIAREWGEVGIRSNCLVAGFMETEMSSSLSETQKSRIYQRTAMKQPVDMDSVVETITFLISDKAKSITGQNVNVDCGTI